ncbi:DEAD/DEAH box helicase [Hyphomonas sp. KY3]|uniref:DEAD/DEAH box helicase n=1 Tax=Hyphomonas sp. KY3 TaxID=2016196 RepID=UPI001A8E4AFE|nr:DEAD/DEAH box helicase [Hyphomonas sp. KY3]MCI4645255.1 DEAD/DEAH box helicase family protein [Hyphomonadaceae bacterium]QSR21999.1 restriction endonuclease subunit R [Hyphomonas sp. KY3]GJL86600.1 MAG: type III restriction endonuclease subunit R [Minwuia thermotolerans]
MAKAKKPKQLPFGHKLVLNQWIVSLFGYDPLLQHKRGHKSLKPFKPFADMLSTKADGLDADNLHRFYKHLDLELQEGAAITKGDLLRYEQNIVSHTLAINEKRQRPIVWKYYQWLSLLFAEIYLDRYFADIHALRRDLNTYVMTFNAYWEGEGYETGITPFTLDELNKVCLQNATGSGKTLLMHVNFLQFRHYAGKSALKDDLTRTILITPNEGLSRQHAGELKASGIIAERLITDSGDLLSMGRNGLRQVDFTEVTKLAEQDGPNIIAVRNLGDQNLLLVDEAHRGMGSTEERGWFANRAKLAERGFVFEYSATFKEATTAAKRDTITEAYAKSVLFDYSYRYFYEDGYGKDYRIFNLPRTFDELQFSYLTACLLAYYQQLRLYEDKKIEFADYNMEKPLWVFVGASVTGGKKTKIEEGTISDVGKIIAFLARFLSDSSAAENEIQNIISGNGEKTGLLDAGGNDIFSGGFAYLNTQMTSEGMTARDFLKDIHQRVFQSSAGGQLAIARIKGDDNEIMLRVGQSETPFGLINVGDASGLSSHIADRGFDNVTVLDSEFSDTLFGQINESSSPLNLLIGSKRFVEGWDCWRVSTLGLMHVGKSEGSQIIQLFGRGVRLKGHDWSLQRSGFSTPSYQPDFIQYAETLNVFGVEADFMERFRAFLEEEELPSNDKKEVFQIPLNVTYDFGQNLMVLRPRRKKANGKEYDFKRDAAVPMFGEVPDKLREKIIAIDWYPRIQSLESRRGDTIGLKNEQTFSSLHAAFLDEHDLFFRLERFKRERTWHNFNIQKDQLKPLLADGSWYKIIVPSGRMTFDDPSNIALWHEMAAELLQKYAEEYYNYRKAAFIEPRLELRPLAHDDQNIPTSDFYQLLVDSSESKLISDIEALSKELAAKKKGVLTAGDLKGCLLSNHLYEPVLHVRKGGKVQVTPVSLNESEIQFVEDLVSYLDLSQANFNQDGIEAFLLRNESRGRGMGFFEAGNFYPDFLLWLVKGDLQSLAFIEPHGLQHEGPGHKKIAFHQTIKDIEQRLGNPNVSLNSFIITPSRHSKLNWGLSIDELNDLNVYFMEDQAETYVPSIFDALLASGVLAAA